MVLELNYILLYNVVVIFLDILLHHTPQKSFLHTYIGTHQNCKRLIDVGIIYTCFFLNPTFTINSRIQKTSKNFRTKQWIIYIVIMPLSFTCLIMIVALGEFKSLKENSNIHRLLQECFWYLMHFTKSFVVLKTCDS